MERPPACCLNKIEPKDAYFYVFGVDGSEKVSGFDDAVLALYLTQRMRVHPVPDIGDVSVEGHGLEPVSRFERDI